jgi:FixJ family two-component response regulator
MFSWPTAIEEWVGIVDDDESIRRSLARYLRVNGIATRTFGSAEEFLQCEGDLPRCLVIDVQLGTSTGFELRDRLAARVRTIPPIVFITARDDLAALQQTNGDGACGWLRKPFRADDLLALIRPHLREASGAKWKNA